MSIFKEDVGLDRNKMTSKNTYKNSVERRKSNDKDLPKQKSPFRKYLPSTQNKAALVYQLDRELNIFKTKEVQIPNQTSIFKPTKTSALRSALSKQQI